MCLTLNERSGGRSLDKSPLRGGGLLTLAASFHWRRVEAGELLIPCRRQKLPCLLEQGIGVRFDPGEEFLVAFEFRKIQIPDERSEPVEGDVEFLTARHLARAAIDRR